MGIPLIVAGLVVAAIAAALVGLNTVALRVFLRERQRIAMPTSGKLAWALTALGALSGPLAPLFATVGVVFATISLRSTAPAQTSAAISPVFPLPRSVWGEGGPQLPARIALVNGAGILIACAAVVAGVYFNPQFV